MNIVFICLFIKTSNIYIRHSEYILYPQCRHTVHTVEKHNLAFAIQDEKNVFNNSLPVFCAVKFPKLFFNLHAFQISFTTLLVLATHKRQPHVLNTRLAHRVIGNNQNHYLVKCACITLINIITY